MPFPGGGGGGWVFSGTVDSHLDFIGPRALYDGKDEDKLAGEIHCSSCVRIEIKHKNKWSRAYKLIPTS